MNKKHKSKHEKLMVCPRCFDYHFSSTSVCCLCGCKKGMISALYKIPDDKSKIPYEDWYRILKYRKLNGYSYIPYEHFLKTAVVIGKKYLLQEKRSYIVKKSKYQKGNFGGIANHAGVNQYIRVINGGGCSPK